MGVNKTQPKEHHSITELLKDVAKPTKDAELNFGDSYNTSVAESSFEKIAIDNELSHDEKINELIDLKQSITQSITMHQIKEYTEKKIHLSNKSIPKNMLEDSFTDSNFIEHAYELVSKIEKFIHTKHTFQKTQKKIEDSVLTHKELALLILLLKDEKVFTAPNLHIENVYYKLTGKSGGGFRDIISNIRTNSTKESINNVKLTLQKILKGLDEIKPVVDLKTSKNK
jgi:Fe2+ transport system protein B